MLPAHYITSLPKLVLGNPLTVDELVFAIYPDTTCFYPGCIVNGTHGVDSDEKTHLHVRFEDEEPDANGNPPEKIICRTSILPYSVLDEWAVGCSVCDKKITTADPRIWSQCSSCKEYKSMHHNCLKTYLKVTDMIVPEDTTEEHYIQSAEFTCSQCLSPCFICGSKHAITKPRVKTYNCASCNTNPPKTCLLIVPDRSGEGGCISVIRGNENDKTDMSLFPCKECHNKSLVQYKKRKIFHDKMTETLENEILEVIMTYLIKMDSFTDEFKQNLMGTKQCIVFIKRHFSHLNSGKHNIYLVESPTDTYTCGFDLTVDSLHKLLSDDMVFDTSMMNLLINCLNGVIYHDKCVRLSTNEIPNDYQCQFGKPQFNISMNPLTQVDVIKAGCANFTDPLKIKVFYESVIHDWEDNLIPKFWSDRCFFNISDMDSVNDNVDMTLSDLANNGSQEDIEWSYHIPLKDRNGHWMLLDVIMPINGNNGLVNISDFHPQRPTKNESHVTATMWYAKLFGLLWNWKSKDLSINKEILYYTGDMNTDDFVLENVSDKEAFLGL